MISSIRMSPGIKNMVFQRYIVPDRLYLGHFYPPYCSGGGYVMSTDLVPKLYQATLTTSIINIEDAFMGILARKVGVHPRHHGGFMNYGFFGPRVDTCRLRSPKTMVIHYGLNSPDIIRDIWNRFVNDPKRCSDVNQYIVLMKQRDITPPNPFRFPTAPRLGLDKLKTEG